MKTATFDSGLHWDDPNLRWGEPAFLLEPGDPGYVNPLPPQTKTKRKTMKRNFFYPVRQSEQIVWLTNFYNKLTGYGTVLGLTAGQVTAAVGDAKWLVYVLQQWLPATRAWAIACTEAAVEAQSGTATGVLTLPVFTPPPLPAGVVAVAAGALDRTFVLVQSIKDNPACTDAIANDLGILGGEQVAPDLSTVQPVIGAVVSGSAVNIKWGWGGNAAFLDSCEIQVDRADGKGFVLLTIDTTPNYTDTQPFPASAMRWTYKAIYRAADAQVGVWSQTVNVTVPA
jgi:hypothetical protein